ncbi:LysM peptidoglycan-binding domain-containing protein [Vibrio cholerae]|uniref:LysM peptidoglycan-binding domain-containing protein n=1 Tax=Vibrio cholerae TaxID=666 RepID=UPI001302AC95|nr:LysM peptidoglycan-binding domain-containing protein [Vibrio cholerae]EKF9473833.1 LysM peptidoglycan-binding domain-containing protein [Vibrio cholerae]EKF9727527.1 LysM peptidoglycan-binding domain-containing protein [Vibrio cholerae]HCF7778014.1 LysM peptidoglycan-binding domain-containing protein [Vibrio cholerae]HCF7785309.1 LysM peptidoglycan-binding domain-containing protein [Vibrio cholerae]
MDLTVGYRVVRLTELMAYEFGQVEGDIGRLDERALGSALPQGISYSSFMDKLKSGELALLTDSPSKPVMLRDGMSKSWSLSAEGQEVLSPEAKSAYLSRTRMSGGAAGSAAPTQSTAGYAPNIEETYVPEPVKPDTSDAPPKLQYEYCFEVACSDETFRKSVGYAFELAKTKQESLIGRWQTEATEHGTKYIAHTAFDEPKKLVAKVASNALGMSVPNNVQVKPIGSGVVREAFIPVVPSVQLGERLGLPTEGYYYHFYNGRLVQEYKLLGNGKWAFYATRSTHEQLNDEQGYNIYQSAILVYWKLEGKDVENQHLIYLEQPITREELDNLNDDWLAQHGIKLDINELLAAPKLPVAERQTIQPAETEKAESKPETHTVGTDSKTNQRESWGVIAEQYGLSAKQLLDLNPKYNADPMSLKVGDRLTVQQPVDLDSTKTVQRDLPPVEPKTYNQAANTHYAYNGNFQGTSVKPISSETVLDNGLVVANLAQISPQDVDDVYLVFADKKMSVEDFAQETYLSKDKAIIDHVFKSNPHLKRSFSQIIEGMPLVVSPWVEKHPDEEFAIKQANDLMTEFLKLSSEEKKWFAEHHETATNALLVAATSGLDVYQGESASTELSDFNLNHIVAGTGAVVAGAQVQGDKLGNRMKSFAEYSRYIAEKTKGLSGQALYSNPDYKAWRREARDFQKEMKSILSEVGKPGYIKNVQAKRINDYLNVGKRQLYRAKNFSKALSGIEMTSLYKQAMSFSRFLGVANGLVIGAGLYGNAVDVAKTCNTSGWFENACNRSLVKNAVSGSVNIGGGIGIGLALGLIPVTGGVSILLIAGGAFIWGMYGTDFSNEAGTYVEELLFD